MFDFLITVAVLAVIAFPVIAIIALVRSIELSRLVFGLDARLRALEHALPPGEASRAPAAAPRAAATPAPPPPAASPEQAPPPPPPSPPQPSPTSVPPARAPAAAATPSPGPIGFEERFGTRWVVWVGGVALALGGVFLVRYTIQQGLILPGVRIALGALLAAALVAAGEWARRKETLSGLPGLPSAHIPSVLTAAGTTVAYAMVYAAYALYGFLPPAVAFSCSAWWRC
jgi:uncharacterized membrane protein